MFGRRVPANLICILSAILALVCGLVAYNAFQEGVGLLAIVAAVLTLWFLIDALRALFWIKSTDSD